MSRAILSALPLLLLVAGAAWAQPKQGATVEARLSKFHSDKGQVILALFKKGQGFPEKINKASRRGRTTIKNRKAVYRFKNVQPGTWAIAVIHDENKNGKMDTNFLGIPKEGYGASLNPRPSVGAPDFEDASFTVKQGDRAFKIRIKY